MPEPPPTSASAQDWIPSLALIESSRESMSLGLPLPPLLIGADENGDDVTIAVGSGAERVKKSCVAAWPPRPTA